MSGNKVPAGRWIVLFFIVVWAIVSLTALASMYRLWWQRERVAYLGQTVETQREAIWKNAGLPLELLTAVRDLQTTWPPDVAYTFSGAHDQRSYAEYLLIPRLPNGSASYTINTDGTFSKPGRGIATSSQDDATESSGMIRSLVLSVLSLCGLAVLIRSGSWLNTLSFPECFALSCLVVHCVAIGSMSLFGTLAPGFWLIAFAGLVGLIVSILRRHRASTSGVIARWSLPSLASGKDIRQQALAGFCLVLIGLAVGWSFLMAVVVVPDDWDAWAIWGAKAKILLLGTGGMTDVTHFGHSDYPVLWPTIWAFSAWFSGGWEELWSRGWGSVFALMSVWEIGVIVKRQTRETTAALLGGALFISMPVVPLVASWSYAEAPFWLFATASAGCVLLGNPESTVRGTIIAALLAAAAAYTKNEGVLFAVSAALWILLLPGERRLFRVAVFVGIFVACYAPWLYWIKIVLGLGSHATAGLHFSIDNLLRALARTPPALEAIFRIWSDVRLWNIVLAGVFVIALGSLASPRYRNYLILPGAMMGGYFIITIFHHADIYWQVGTSWNRLTLHFMPFLVILSVCSLSGSRLWPKDR